jgi:hypothetical protein
MKNENGECVMCVGVNAWFVSLGTRVRRRRRREGVGNTRGRHQGGTVHSRTFQLSELDPSGPSVVEDMTPTPTL